MNELKKLRFVDWTDEESTINQAIAFPGTEIHCQDGRVFRVRSWCPSVTSDGLVSAKLEVVVLMNNASKEHQQ